MRELFASFIYIISNSLHTTNIYAPIASRKSKEKEGKNLKPLYNKHLKNCRKVELFKDDMKKQG